MREVLITDATRSPFGRRRGSLAGIHAVDLLARIQQAVLERTSLDPGAVDQVITGCVGQIGMQAMNVGRTAWLVAGLPAHVPCTTVDAQCGSSQQALTMGHAAIAAGTAEVVLVCGVEVMSRVPIGATVPADGALGKPITRAYWRQHEYTTQFEGAERVAERWGITRAEADAYGKLSQDRAAAARAAGRFAGQIVPAAAPVLDADGRPSGETRTLTEDECIRETSLAALAGLTPTGRPDGVHTAGTSSQISDGAAAVLLMSTEAADRHGIAPMASVAGTTLVGSDPVLMLTGPIPATQALLERSGLAVSDLDVVEINEAFASVVLAWEREYKVDMATVNPNGGAIALGHPLGATGCGLVVKAVHELRRVDGEHALVTMCCGGGLGTGTLLRRAG
ncbi:acetyl-CoA C-acyltransferase [Pseudonocardia sp. GCM10023141]|uniref:acetyl-CoA C-acyltransferase n=1 Tax=Pseudonocardia sp. GCM10023141 TaxID=3252653 RepID=UPI003621CD4A